MELNMRLFLSSLAALALISGAASAIDDHHDKKQQETESTYGSGSTYGLSQSYGSGTDGHTMNHGEMNHGAMIHGEMNHGEMEHGDMNHGEGHMMGSATMPADGAIMPASPEFIGVNFGHAMTVETVMITTLTGEMIELDVSEIGHTSHVMLPAPELQADDYTVDWRASGADGHVMSGSFAFTVE